MPVPKMGLAANRSHLLRIQSHLACERERLADGDVVDGDEVVGDELHSRAVAERADIRRVARKHLEHRLHAFRVGRAAADENRPRAFLHAHRGAADRAIEQRHAGALQARPCPRHVAIGSVLVSIIVDYMTDWVAEKLGGKAAGI